MFNNIPYLCMVNAEIIVYYDVTECSNQTPIDLWALAFQSFRQTLCRFGQDVKIAQNGILRHCVVKKDVLAARCVLLYARDTFSDEDKI